MASTTNNLPLGKPIDNLIFYPVPERGVRTFVKKCHEMMAINFPVEVFEGLSTGKTITWDSFTNNTRGRYFAMLVGFFAGVNSRSDIGEGKAGDGAFGQHRYIDKSVVGQSEPIPRLRLFQEGLQNNFGGIAGVRLWIFVHDSKLYWSEAVFKQLKDNLAKSGLELSNDATVSRGPRRAQAKANNANNQSAWKITDAYKSVTAQQLVLEIYKEYRGRDRLAADADELNRQYSRLGDPNNIFSPTRIFSAENAMTDCIQSVCSEQTDITNYFDLSNSGASCQSFQGFPKGHLVSEIFNNSFTPDLLHYIPISRIDSNDLNAVRNNYEKAGSLAGQIEELELQLQDESLNEEARGDTMQELSRLNTELEEFNRKSNVILFTKLSKGMSSNYSGNNFSSIQDTAMKQNATLQQRAENTTRQTTIKQTYKMGTTEYKNEMTKFRREAVRQFIAIMETTDKCTDVIINLRKYFSNINHNIYTAWYNPITNLSPTGNGIAKMVWLLEKVLKVYTHHVITILLYFCVLDAGHYSYNMSMNMVQSGTGGVGKSERLKKVQAMSFPGSILPSSHVTAKARTTEEDRSDWAIVAHELGQEYTGLDSKGNRVPADNLLKTQLSERHIVSLVYQPDENGNRKSRVIATRTMNSLIGILNDKTDTGDTALNQRFLRVYTDFIKRDDLSLNSIVLNPGLFDTSDIEAAVVSHFCQTHATVFVVEKAIEAGALPDVEMSVAKLFVSEVLKRLTAMTGVEVPVRLITTILESTRTMSIFSAVLTQLGELGDIYREEYYEKDFSERDKLSEEFLIDLTRFLIANEECATFILTSLESNIVPHNKAEICRIVGSLAGIPDSADKLVNQYDDEVFDRGTISWKEDASEMSKNGKAQEVTTDYNYVSFRGETKQSLVETIRDKLANKISSNDLEKEINEMLNMIVEVDSYCVQGSTVEPRRDHLGNTIKIKIPLAYMQNDPIFQRQKRICIATGYIRKKFDGILKRCIEDTLCHKYATPKTLITGYYYKHTMDDGAERTIYSVLDTIKVDPNQDNIRTVDNTFNIISELDDALIFGRQMDGENIIERPSGIAKGISELPAFVLNCDPEEVLCPKFWKEQGLIDNDDLKKDDCDILVALPSNTQTYIQAIRNVSDVHRNTLTIENYPEDMVSAILANERTRKQIMDSPEEFESTHGFDKILTNEEESTIHKPFKYDLRPSEIKFTEMEIREMGMDDVVDDEYSSRSSQSTGDKKRKLLRAVSKYIPKKKIRPDSSNQITDTTSKWD